MSTLITRRRVVKPSDSGSTAGDIVWILSYLDLIPGNRQLVTDGAYNYINSSWVLGDAFMIIIGCSGSVSVSDLSFDGTCGDDITVYDTTDSVEMEWPEWVEDYTWYCIEFVVTHNIDSWYEIVNTNTQTRVRVNYAISGMAEPLPMYFRPNSTRDISVNPKTDSDTYYIGDLSELYSTEIFDTTVTINDWATGDILDPVFFCRDLPDDCFPSGEMNGSISYVDCENVDIYYDGSLIQDDFNLTWEPSYYSEIKKSTNQSYDPPQYPITATNYGYNPLSLSVSIKDINKPGKISIAFLSSSTVAFIYIDIILNSL